MYNRRDFNPRTPVGCDYNAVTGLPWLIYFNPRTPVGCDVDGQIGHVELERISIHAPQWGATRCDVMDDFEQVISIHAPSGVRLDEEPEPAPLGLISIHAPQWGATFQIVRTSKCFTYFNPRTPVGCDLTCRARRSLTRFQSTHPSGVRLATGLVDGLLIGISIHAPQWGATRREQLLHGLLRDFNPRTPVGCDSRSPRSRPPARNFNPRTPVGCDCTSSADLTSGEQFQSTHPSGVRLSLYVTGCGKCAISIHAPQWGATRHTYLIMLPTLFQSTHPSGVRPFCGTTPFIFEWISIHAPQWGATRSLSSGS